MSAATNSPTRTDETINASVRTIVVTPAHDPTETKSTHLRDCWKGGP